MSNLSRYQCHKQVNAVKISAIEFDAVGAAIIACTGGSVNTNSGFRERFKGSEADLGYYVVYDDGYESWSPTRAFEEGYTEL